MSGLERFLIGPGDSLRQAMACIDRNLRGIALVVDLDGRLEGTITDGDIRRAILAGVSLDEPLRELLGRKASSPYPTPVTAPVGSEPGALIDLMIERRVRQVPLLDENGRVQEVAVLDDLVPPPSLPLQAVIMAGGAGTRLRPLTEHLPKPLLPVGDRPLMERTIEHLRQAGIRQVNVSTHYMADKIAEHFGDGSAFGVELRYVAEDRPLGTAGALGLVDSPDQPLLVVNGDILTRVDYRAMLAFHRKEAADLTVAVRQIEVQVPYGTLECDGPRVLGVQEKPVLRFLVNAGIYLVEPAAAQAVPAGQPFDMPDLIDVLVTGGRKVVSFPIVEYWLDIGEHDAYRQAQQDIKDDPWTA